MAGASGSAFGAAEAWLIVADVRTERDIDKERKRTGPALGRYFVRETFASHDGDKKSQIILSRIQARVCETWRGACELSSRTARASHGGKWLAQSYCLEVARVPHQPYTGVPTSRQQKGEMKSTHLIDKIN